MTARFCNGVELSGACPLPGSAGTGRGPAVVAGTAPGHEAEFLAAWRIGRRCPVVGVNGFGLDFAGVCDHWVSLHPEAFFHLRTGRALTHSDKPHPDADQVWPIATAGG